MSDGPFSEPPRNRSGAIQLQLPTITPPSYLAMRPGALAVMRERPKSKSADFPLSSMSTLSWKRSPFSIRYNNIALFLTGMYCFQVSMHNLKQAGNERCRGKCHLAADCHIEPRQMHGYWIYTQFAVGRGWSLKFLFLMYGITMNGLLSNIFAWGNSNVLVGLI